MRSGILKAAVLLAAVAVLGPARADAASGSAHVTVVVLPARTGPGTLQAAGLAPGLLSAGMGSVPAEQTYLDIGQGNRINQSLYDDPLPHLARAGARVQGWGAAVKRADGAPADLVPGLLASAVEAARPGPAAVVASPGSAEASIVAAARAGRVASPPKGCRRPACPPAVTLIAGGAGALPSLVRSLRGRDLLIALGSPPPSSEGQLAVGIAGAGFSGNLTSDSTRLAGYVLSTDLAPTILGRLGIPVPSEMSGEAIHSVDGGPDAADVVSLGARMGQIQPRRGRVIGLTIAGWALVAGLAALIGGWSVARRAAGLLALAVILLPALLLLTSGLRPSLAAEWLIVALGAPALAALIAWVLPGYRALAAACAVTVLAHAADMVAGSPLTSLSLLGPNPGLGIRFYGIGNELEAALAPLALGGMGAALTAFAPRAGARSCAIVFLCAGLVLALVFAAGRLGADVGAAIVFPAGAAVAAAVIARRRRAVVLAIAAPLAVLGLLAVIDLVSGGNAHVTRSVLDAGGLHDLANVAERRLRLSADSFGRIGNVLLVGLVLALALLAWWQRQLLLSWFAGRPAMWAGVAGGVAATLVGTLVNDSGAIVLEVGCAFLLAFVVFAWSEGSRSGLG